MKKILLFMCTVMTIMSCSQDEEVIIGNKLVTEQANYHISPQEAGDIAIQFVEQMQNIKNSSRASSAHRRVKQVEALVNNSNMTRTATEPSASIDTLLYFVNFENDKGYVIVGADRRTEPIFAVIDSGNYSISMLENEENEAFLDFLDTAVEMVVSDIENPSNDNEKTRAAANGWSIKTICHPLLKTKWGQRDPYNMCCPTDKNGNQYVTGCVPTAFAQVLSYFQNIGHVSWNHNSSFGESYLHWTQIIADCNSNYGMLSSNRHPQSSREVANLMRFLGTSFNADYGSQTSANMGDAIDWINKYGGLSATKLKDYDESAIVGNLALGNIVLGRGYAKKKKFIGIKVGYGKGHAWVYDGYCNAMKDGQTKVLLHCNWGWDGENDGYYLSKTFTTAKGPEIHDDIDVMGNNSSTNTYKYKLQYSVVSR